MYSHLTLVRTGGLDQLPERLVCVEELPGGKPVLATAVRAGLPAGASVCETPVDVLRDYYAANGAEGVAGLYVEHLFPPSSIMPPERKVPLPPPPNSR